MFRFVRGMDVVNTRLNHRRTRVGASRTVRPNCSPNELSHPEDKLLFCKSCLRDIEGNLDNLKNGTPDLNL